MNRVLLIGRLTKDPELRHTKNETPVTEISLAINREFNVSDGSRRKEACFVDVVFWARQAEVAAQYCKTGSEIFIEGRLELDQWQSAEGQKRSRLRVVCEHFQFLDKVQRNGGDGESPEASESQEWDEAAAGVTEEAVPTD